MDSSMLLLDHGAAHDPVNSKKRTALHHAVERPDGNFALALLEYAGRDPDRGRFARFVNAKDEDGETVWAWGEGEGHAEVGAEVEGLWSCGGRLSGDEVMIPFFGLDILDWQPSSDLHVVYTSLSLSLSFASFLQ